jgi:hypothetical protein
MKISADFSRGSTILFFTCGLATLLCARLLVASLISRSLANGSFATKQIIVIAEQGQNTRFASGDPMAKNALPLRSIPMERVAAPKHPTLWPTQD